MTHVMHVATECAPWAKAGGLADVLSGLPKALGRPGLGVRASVLLPRYGHLDLAAGEAVLSGDLRHGDRRVAYAVRPAHVDAGFPLLLVDSDVFAPPGVYADARTGQPFADELLRHLVLCHAALELAHASRRGGAAGVPAIDVLHAHDFHAGLVTAWQRFGQPEPQRPRIPVVLTIHNALYQGRHDWSKLAAYDLPRLVHDEADHDGQFNSLKVSVLAAHRVTTVSPNHARELSTMPAASHGLDYAFRLVPRGVLGILNGIDAETWDPSRDPHLRATYDRDRPQGKQHDKAALCAELDLDASRPLLAFIGRLVPEKGVPLMLLAIPQLLARERDVQVVFVGMGFRHYEEGLQALATAHPRNIRAEVRQDERLAHELYAAADVFLMPSSVEPCGLAQMYALRYGAVPVVHPTGGLADTVAPFDPSTGRGTGLWMWEHSASSLVEAVATALSWWRQPELWATLRRNGMEADFSWQRSAQAYAQLYEEVRAS